MLVKKRPVKDQIYEEKKEETVLRVMRILKWKWQEEQ